MSLKILSLIVIDIFSKGSRTDFHVLLAFAIFLSQVRNHDALCSILVNVNEICSHTVANVHDCRSDPKVVVVSILVCARIEDNVTQKSSQANDKNVSSVSVDSQTRVWIFKQGWVPAKGFTLTGGIAVGDSCQVDIRIWVRSDKFKDIIAAAKLFIHRLTFSHVSSWVALQISKNLHWNNRQKCQRSWRMHSRKIHLQHCPSVLSIVW